MNTTHTLSEIYLHLVWSTKNRQPLITPDIKNRLYSVILKETTAMSFYPLALGGIEDHVHLLVRCTACFDIPALMHKVKGVSSHFVNHILLSPDYFSWRSGYYVCSVSPQNYPTIEKYILAQEAHHRMGNLKQELEMIDF